LQRYHREGSESGWHFLTSRKEENIKKLADTVGFGYTYVPATKQYAHPTPLIFCTPSGRVSRYLDIKQYDPQTIKFSLMEAGEGKVGTITDQIFLSCFHYDPSTGRYAPQAMLFMQIGAGAVVLALGVVLIRRWSRDARKAKQQSLPPAVAG
jgi:protein SCO1